MRTNYWRCHEQKWFIKIRGGRRIRAYLNLSLAAAAASTDYWKDGRAEGGDLHLVLRLHPPARRPRPLPPASPSLPPVVWKNMFVFGEKSKGAATAAAAADITRPRGRRSRRRRAAAGAASPVAAAGGLTGDAKAGSKRRKYFDAFLLLLLPTFLLHLLTTLQTAATTCTSLFPFFSLSIVWTVFVAFRHVFRASSSSPPDRL